MSEKKVQDKVNKLIAVKAQIAKLEKEANDLICQLPVGEIVKLNGVPYKVCPPKKSKGSDTKMTAPYLRSMVSKEALAMMRAGEG